MNDSDWRMEGTNGSVGANESLGDEAYHGEPFHFLLPLTMIYSAIFVIGVVGNVSTCIVITRNRHMHTATNYYLFSLAVSDLLLLVSGLPQEVYMLWYGSFVFGDAVCVLISFAAETCANATVLTITAFTVERYVAICHPFLSHAVTKLSRAVKFVIAIWLLALSLAVPQAIQFGVVEDSVYENDTLVGETCYCTMTTQDSRMGHFFGISTLVFFVTPMTLITVLYIIIGYKLRRARLIKRPSLTSMAGREIRGQKHVVRMLIAVVVAFFICWAPFHAQRLLAVYIHAREETKRLEAVVVVYRVLTYISGVLYFLSTCINPLLYNIMSNKFRQAFKVTLAQLCGRGDKVSIPVRSYSVLSRGNTQIIHEGRESFNRRLRLVERPPLVVRINTTSESSAPDSESLAATDHQPSHYMGNNLTQR